MISSLALVFLVGLSSAFIFQKLHLPRIIGMLATGILLGPFVLDLFDPAILGISGELRRIALVIILIKAGLSLDLAALRKVGRPALLLSFLPALFEIGATVLFAPLLLGVSLLDAAIIGAVLGAVSPAVVVPRMVALMEDGYGRDKHVPELILAGASLDDVFVIVLFSTFLTVAEGGAATVAAFLDIPISIVLGILVGVAAGLLLSLLFEFAHRRGTSIRQSVKVILVLGTAFLLTATEEWLDGVVAVSGLLAVMSMACAIRRTARSEVSVDLSGKFGRLWLGAELMLFVLVGAAVDVRYTLEAGGMAVLLIFLVLIFRSLGVLLSLLGTDLSARERLFTVIAYLPKATVQAAIGAVPLAMGLPVGKTVLSVAVLSILITAPLGAIGMDLTSHRLLSLSSQNDVFRLR